jgi:hypothetical protein
MVRLTIIFSLLLLQDMSLCLIVIKYALFWDSDFRLKLGNPFPSGEHCEHDSGAGDECGHGPEVESR